MSGAREKIPGTASVAARMVRAEEDFIETLMICGGVDRAGAERALVVYRKNRAVRMDAVGGRMTVVHGALLDADVIRKASV